ncbi:MAG: VWA domain-containing protein [Bryobacteraceae bacterium]
MKRRAFLPLLAAGGPCAVAGAALFRQPPQEMEEAIKLEVTRVNILFTVTDRRGRFVNNLSREDFDLIENKRRQNIIEFSAESDLPLRIALLIDVSNSIRDRFRFELEAAAEFLERVIRPRVDKALIYAFHTEPELVVPLTDDINLLGKKLRELRAGGGTAMYEALYLACRDHLMLDQPRYKYRRAVIIIGDGEDNSSRFTRDQALEMAYRAEAVIYAISTNISRVETDGDRVLRYYARETGGRVFFPFKAEDLAQDFENIANELRSQYSILYRPDPLVTDGQFHPVELRVRGRKDLFVRARRGYYAPKL